MDQEKVVQKTATAGPARQEQILASLLEHMARLLQTSEAEIGRGIRTRNWKYHVVADPEQHDGRGGAAEYREAFLYDMNADPYELCNLAGVESHRELSDALQERLQQRVAAAGQPRLTIRAAEPRKLGQRVMKADPLDPPGTP